MDLKRKGGAVIQSASKSGPAKSQEAPHQARGRTKRSQPDEDEEDEIEDFDTDEDSSESISDPVESKKSGRKASCSLIFDSMSNILIYYRNGLVMEGYMCDSQRAMLF